MASKYNASGSVINTKSACPASTPPYERPTLLLRLPGR
jgi:hypothetical protein